MKTHYFFALLIGISFSLLLNAQQQLGNTILGDTNSDLTGQAISMPNNKTIAIGSPRNAANGSLRGHVRVFSLINGAWVQKGTNIDGLINGHLFGSYVSMPDSRTVAVGHLNRFNVRIFKWNGLDWVQKGLDIDTNTTSSGHSIRSLSMLDSNTIVIGTPDGGFASGLRGGYVRVFTWNGSSWVQKGGAPVGEGSGDKFGISVSMSDINTIAIGASENDGNGFKAGHVRVHKWDGVSWVQKGADIDGEAAGDLFGSSVSMPDSNTVAVGAYENDGNGSNAGHVRIFRWNGLAWVQKGVDIDGDTTNDRFGESISMSDSNHITIGAEGNDLNGSQSGQVRVYRWNGSAWVQKGIDYNGSGVNQRFGTSVSMPDSNTFAAGAEILPRTLDTAYVKVFNLCNSISAFTTSACFSYTSPSGNYTWITSGIYNDTVPNSQNCDSILTINLTVVPMIKTVSNFSNSLAANEFNAGYQWVYCDSNYAPVFGATNQFFIPPVSGNYAVILSKNGCVDTSACENVTIVGMLENVFSTARVFPNPTDGAFTIDLGTENQEVDLRVNSIDGQLVFQKNKVNSNQLFIDLSNQPKGVYFITLQNKDAISIIKLVRD